MTNADVIRSMTDKQLDEFLAQFEIGDIDYAVGDMVKELAKDTGGDLINRQAAIDAINQICPIDTEYDCTLLDRVDVRCVLTDLPSAQPERTCVNCGRTVNNGGWYADGRTRCPIEEHYALPKDGYCHLWEKRNITDDDYPERRTDGRD